MLEFVPGIRGRLSAPYFLGGTGASEPLMRQTTFLHKLSGLNLGFNLLGLPKKPEGQSEQ
jgi:hypothetical protein